MAQDDPKYPDITWRGRALRAQWEGRNTVEWFAREGMVQVLVVDYSQQGGKPPSVNATLYVGDRLSPQHLSFSHWDTDPQNALNTVCIEARQWAKKHLLGVQLLAEE